MKRIPALKMLVESENFPEGIALDISMAARTCLNYVKVFRASMLLRGVLLRRIVLVTAQGYTWEYLPS